MEKVKQNPGKYILFGDKLASHFNINVVRAAEQNNVHFVMLPLNATHLPQPPDVAVFSSLKRSWRDVTTNNTNEEGNSDDAWKCKSCEEIWHGEDGNRNRWIVCDACDGKYHLQCSGIYYKEEQYYEVDIENKLFLC